MSFFESTSGAKIFSAKPHRYTDPKVLLQTTTFCRFAKKYDNDKAVDCAELPDRRPYAVFQKKKNFVLKFSHGGLMSFVRRCFFSVQHIFLVQNIGAGFFGGLMSPLKINGGPSTRPLWWATRSRTTRCATQ